MAYSLRNRLLFLTALIAMPYNASPLKAEESVFYCTDQTGPSGQCASGWRQIPSCLVIRSGNESCEGGADRVVLCANPAGVGKTTCFSNPEPVFICTSRLQSWGQCREERPLQPVYPSSGQQPSYYYPSAPLYPETRPANPPYSYRPAQPYRAQPYRQTMGSRYYEGYNYRRMTGN